MAAEKGIDLATVKGSGPHGRIVKADIANANGNANGSGAPQAGAARAQGPVSGAPAGAKTNPFGMAYTEIPNNNI